MKGFFLKFLKGTVVALVDAGLEEASENLIEEIDASERAEEEKKALKAGIKLLGDKAGQLITSRIDNPK